MAESSGEKTEMPTQKKLRDARQKGQVCTSKDIVSTAILVVLFALLGWMGVALVDDGTMLLSYVGQRLEGDPFAATRPAMGMAALIVCKHSFIFVVVAAIIGIIANTAQIGFLFTFEPIIPKLEKLNPVEGAKKIFSMKNLFEFLKNIVYTAFGYIVIAIVDRIFQGRNFTKQMMMTKDEVKREYKEMEGSQEVKQAQRQFRDEILNGPDPRQSVSKANVVVTNPTHISVGIRYAAEEAPLPRICVMGADRIAKIIREEALSLGIPIIEDVPLARSLYAKGRVEDFVPEDFLEPVAEVLKWAKQLQDARKEEAELDSVTLDELPDDQHLNNQQTSSP